MKAVRALRKFISKAVFTESPELSNTAKSPVRQKPEMLSSEESFLASVKKKKYSKSPSWLSAETSHPSHAGSRGTGWPQWSPCQSQPTRKRPPQQPGHQRSYEGCLPRLPSQPAQEPLVLGIQREPVLSQLILRPLWWICHSRRLIVQHIQVYCAARIKGAHADVKASLCLQAQEILLHTPSPPLAPES